MTRQLSALLLACGLVSACTVGPDYRRPNVTPPAQIRGASTSAAPDAPSLGDERWWTVFQDQQLQTLVRTALEHNFDLGIAAARILEAEAQLGITRSDQFPTVDAGVSGQGQRTRLASRNGDPVTVSGIQLAGSAAWQLDFWGRYRRATESARAQLLAAEWGRRAVVTTLISQVADAYFTLRNLDLQHDIAVRTLESRKESLRLTQVRERGGATSLVDVRQAEQLVYNASAQAIDLERRITQQENVIQLLLGGWPDGVPRGAAITEQPHPPDVPSGVPSALLARRPDVQQAEQNLISTNADIGVARAAYFPQIALTGSGGFASTALSSLITGPAAIWSAAASLSQPVFNAGRTRSSVALATARRQEAELIYRRTIAEAFRETSDALVGYQGARSFREQQELLLVAAQDARRLAQIRYEGGVSSYLEVLDAETRLFVAELSLAQARSDELTALVEVYRALGGGWQQS